MDQGELQQLQTWYVAQCDGDWEHAYGVEIDTLDNPGWRLSIDLADTELEDRAFAEVTDNYGHETAWMRCWKEEAKFQACCGPLRLSDAIRVFVDWAATPVIDAV